MSTHTRLFVSGKWGIPMLTMLWCGAVCSQVMTDPTRPAPAWLAAQPKAPGEVVVEQNSEPTLQLLLIGKSRKYAIIDGQIVKPGGSYNGSRLVAIKPGGVVLQSEDGAKILKMHPAIEKTILTNKPGQKTGQQVSRQKTVVIGESK